jgi:hypothetical protein
MLSLSTSSSIKWVEYLFHRIVGDNKITQVARCQWLMAVILATQKAEIRRIMVPSQPTHIVHETLS